MDTQNSTSQFNLRLDILNEFLKSKIYLYDLALKMMVVMILEVVMICGFLCAVGEKCQRRVCHLELYSFFIRDRLFHKKKFPLCCTHIILHRVQVTATQDIDLNERDGLIEFNRVIEIKRQNPQLIVIFAVQNDNFDVFVKMYTTDEYRKKFIRNIIQYAREKTIDGVKIDIQHKEGGNKEKFTVLIKELMAAFSREASTTKRPRLLLTVGIPSDKSFLDKYYDVLEISNPLYSKDTSSTKTIVKYVKANGYGGVLMYQIDDDDGLNDCDTGYNPLSKAVLEECSTN
ncbi:Endochitinase 1 [Bulinus truncatus]|nr:Endochitinase 1 [Bulinus truncatus]